MAGVTGRLRGIVELAHEGGGLDVGRILLAEGPFAHAQYKAEEFDPVWQVGLRKAMLLALVKVVEFERPEVAREDVVGQLLFLEAGEIAQGL